MSSTGTLPSLDEPAPSPRRRRGRLLAVVGALVVALLAGVVYGVFAPNSGPDRPSGNSRAGAGATAQPSGPAGSVLGAGSGGVPAPATGAYLGAYSKPAGTDAGRRQAITAFEAQVGRPMDIDHAYYKWDESFPTADDRWTAQHGRIPFLNWNVTRDSGDPMTYAAIADGSQDAVITRNADAVRAFGAPMFLTFSHEPNARIGTEAGKSGTATEYVAAWRHIVTTFRARGVTNVSWVFVPTAASLRPAAAERTTALYPGDAYIDWIGADGYNVQGCGGHGRQWRSFRAVFANWYAWAKPHGKPLVIAEYGVSEDPAQPGRKGEWYAQAASMMKAWPELKALVYFNASPACPNEVDSSPTALAGFRRAVADPYFSPRLPVTTPAS